MWPMYSKVLFHWCRIECEYRFLLLKNARHLGPSTSQSDMLGRPLFPPLLPTRPIGTDRTIQFDVHESFQTQSKKQILQW